MMNHTSIKIIQVDHQKDFKTFLKFPWEIYRCNPHWVPPLLYDLKKQLNPSKNPFFQEGEAAFWIARINDKVMGRIAASINSAHNRHTPEPIGFFGFFEVINHEPVAHALIQKAGQWLKSHGAKIMLGPVNLNTMHECGLLIKGFDRSPILQMPYNPPYYQKLLESNGLKKEIDLLAFYITEEITRDNQILNKLERIGRRNLENNQITFRHFNKRKFTAEIRHIRELFNDFMQDNWGFVPLSPAEFDFMSDNLKLLLIPELVLFAEVNGKVVGLSLALPNINQVLQTMNGKIFPTGWIKLLRDRKRIKDIRVLLLGIKRPYRNKGIETHFYLETIKKGYQLGFTGAELSWVTERNTTLISILLKLKADLYKRYRVYKVDLRSE